MRGSSSPRATRREANQLKRLQQGSSDARLVRRATVLLMRIGGFLVKQVCGVTGLSRRAIEKSRERWNRRRIRSLQDRPRCGRRPKAVPAIRRLIVRTARTLPRMYGYGFTVWTTGRPAEHIARETGVKLSPERVAQILKREGFSFGLPAHTLQGKRKERPHRRAKKRLRVLKNGLGGPTPAFVLFSEMNPASTCIPT